MRRFSFFTYAAGATAVLALALAVGCKHDAAPAPPTDMQIAGGIQTKLSAEQALTGQEIHVAVQNGVATLSGTVTSDAARALAGAETGSIAGVKTVVNNLTVQTQQPVSSAPVMAAAPAPAPARKPSARAERAQAPQSRPAPMSAPAPMQQQAAVHTPPPPPAPPRPVVKQVTIPAGTEIAVRITETLDTKTTQTNDAFHGSLAGDLMADGVVAIPHGAPVLGRVVDAKEAAHFKGSAALSLELTQLTARGQRLTLATDAYSQQGAGRGKNTAIKAGGGAALGAIIGGLAGGGKGAAIGTLAGAGAGTGVNAATRGQQVVIPSETVLKFRLQSPITVTVTINPEGGAQNDTPYQPTLQRR